MKREHVLPTPEDTRVLGADLAGLFRAGDLVVLVGPLGAGKTALTQGIGRALGVVLDAVHRHGGTVNQFLGDGAMALFEAHEGADDHPERAIAAGLDILRDLAPVAADAHRQHGVNFAMRLGVHTGTISIGAIGVDLRVDYTALGPTARIAASLLRVAGRGELAVTEATRRLVTGPVAFESLGEVAGGDADGIAVYAVVDDPSVAALGLRYERTDGVEVPDGL